MRIALISDIHLGVKQNSEDFNNHIKSFFIDFFIPKIKENSISKVFILGDLFDDQVSLNIMVKNTSIDIFNKMLQECPDIEIYILTGNHDVYYRNTLEVASINIFKKFDKRIHVINKIEKMDLDGCKTLLVPWLIEGSKNLETFNKIINHYTDTNKRSFNLCLGHFEINTFEKVSGVVEKHGFNPEVFSSFDHVFSGHFHLRQKIQNIQYLGCPYEITWNDYGDKKGFYIFDTDNRDSIFIENIVSPKHLKVNLSSYIENNDILESSENNFIKFYIDKKIKPDELLEITNKFEKIKTLKLEIIDETVEGLDDDDTISIEDELKGDVISVLNDYYDQTQHPSDINSDDFKIYINRTYSKVSKNED